MVSIPDIRIKEPAQRKTDYITLLAIFLFVLIIFFELVLVLWLPIHLRSGRNWEHEIAMQEMIELEDNLRANIIGLGRKGVGKKGELEMMSSPLDQIARYLKQNRKKMTREQIREIYDVLQRFENHYHYIRTGNVFTRELKVDPEKYIGTLLKEAGIAKPKTDGGS